MIYINNFPNSLLNMLIFARANSHEEGPWQLPPCCCQQHKILDSNNHGSIEGGAVLPCLLFQLVAAFLPPVPVGGSFILHGW